jgi:cytochrome c-type biogenesis protein
MDLTIGLAFLAGLASFLSPCVFPLVPAYIGYLSGRTIAAGTESRNPSKDKWITLTHGIFFVLGFSIVFITLGLLISSLGQLLYTVRDWVSRIGGVIIVVLGLHLSGLIHIPFLEYDLRPKNSVAEKRSYLSSLWMGIFFSAGWSPCVGPVLGAIYTLTIIEGSLESGLLYLTAYSLGLAIPFLVAAFGIGWVTGLLRKYGKALRIIQIIMAIILVIVGILLFFGVFERLAGLGSWFDFGL